MLQNEPFSAVTVSAGYADYLEVSLEHNRKFFDTYVVVTTPDDVDSQRVAGKYACTLIVTNDGHKTKAFNKGAMIERGLQQLPPGWRVHLDSDIVYPGNFIQRIQLALNDKSVIYGVDRINVVGWQNYQKLLNTGFATRGFEYHHFLTYPPQKAEVGGRLVHESQGWVPLGFTQIWHSSAEYVGIYRVKTYSFNESSAAHSDVQFSLLWDRDHRILIPELFVAHLQTDDTKYGINWGGRITKKFAADNDKKIAATVKAPEASGGCSTVREKLNKELQGV